MANTITKVLELVFKSSSGKPVTVVVQDPKDDVTLAQAQAVMQTVITKNIISSKSGDLVGIEEARIRQLAVTALV